MVIKKSTPKKCLKFRLGKVRQKSTLSVTAEVDVISFFGCKSYLNTILLLFHDRTIHFYLDFCRVGLGKHFTRLKIHVLRMANDRLVSNRKHVYYKFL